MGIADWFSFETAKQKKKKMDRYYKKLYPFGEEQKNWEQDRLNERWTKVLAAEEYDLERPTRSYPKRRFLPQFDDEALEQLHSKYNHADQPDRPPHGRDKAANYAEH